MELGIDGIACLSPPHPDLFPPWKVFLTELFFTFLFMTCILHNVFPRLSIQSDTVLAVASVCVCLYFCIRCCGDYTGAGFNPTVALVNLTFVALVREDSGKRDFIEYLPAYFFSALLAGVLAGLVCKYFVMPCVPHYYDTMLNTMREEVMNRLTFVSGGGSVYQNTDNLRPSTVDPDPLLKGQRADDTEKKEMIK
jgi:hypothetical protein